MNNFQFIMLIIISLGMSCKPMVPENKWLIKSPDENIQLNVELIDGRLWYEVQNKGVIVLNRSSLGAVRTDTDLSQGLSFLEKSMTSESRQSISFHTGKQRQLEVVATEQQISFSNEAGSQLQLEIKVFNDGLALRYKFPEQTGEMVTMVSDNMTFSLPDNTQSWLQPYDEVSKYTPAYEKYYQSGIEAGQVAAYGNGWCFPALFKVRDNWLLISDAGIDGDYAGSHLDNEPGSSRFSLRWPEPGEANGLGAVNPSGRLPWKTSWKTIALGDLNTIVQSDLVKIVSPPSRLQDVSWIRPGRASWSWLSDHPSPKDYNKLKIFVDLAADMGWEYSLVDANWDQMEGGSIQELVSYANGRGVGILMWYNSGGAHNDVSEAPRNLMDHAESRRREFERLQQLGVKGIKVDFFQSDKQMMMELYKQILEDAADFNILVNFHGCTIPKGWSRTYPNLMTMESVRGAETYTFASDYPEKAPELNTILPYTRNVVGSMDYTPVIFSQMQHPHITSYGHEIALSIIFESGWLHFGDGVGGYRSLGTVEREFLSQVPVVWDQVELIMGTPGKDVILARRKEQTWYIAGINGENTPKTWTLDLARFGDNYQLTKIVDGEVPDKLDATVGKASGALSIDVLAFGGFVLKLTPASDLALRSP